MEYRTLPHENKDVSFSAVGTFVSGIKETDLSNELVDRLLFEGLEDTGENADCIIVLGSMKAAQYRVPVAAQAYKAGRAGKILLCGGKLRDFPDGKYSEAEHMRQAALTFGILEEPFDFGDCLGFVLMSFSLKTNHLRLNLSFTFFEKIVCFINFIKSIFSN